MDLATNPFAVLTVIAAPALLTNSTAVLALSTSNRFLRASDRMRSLAGQLDGATLAPHLKELLVRQVTRVERQGVLLLNALRSIYLALGCFAGATIVSILGAVFSSAGLDPMVKVAIVLGFFAGLVGVGSLIFGAANLLHATKLSLLNITEEAAMLRERHSGAKNSPL